MLVSHGSAKALNFPAGNACSARALHLPAQLLPWLGVWRVMLWIPVQHSARNALHVAAPVTGWARLWAVPTCYAPQTGDEHSRDAAQVLVVVGGSRRRAASRRGVPGAQPVALLAANRARARRGPGRPPGALSSQTLRRFQQYAASTFACCLSGRHCSMTQATAIAWCGGFVAW